MWRVHLIYFCLFLVVKVGGQTVAPASTENVNETDLVVLHPPDNVQIVFRGSTEVVVIWYAPRNNNYTHDVETNKTGKTVAYIYPKPFNSTNYQSTAGPHDTGPLTDSVLSLNNSENSNSTFDRTPTGKPTNVSRANATQPIVVRKPNDEIQYYVVFYGLNTSEAMQEVLVGGNQTEVRLLSLTPGTWYRVLILVKYQGGVALSSSESTFLTKGHGMGRDCNCDKHGRDPKNPSCNPNNYRWCQCKQAYTGLFCEVCEQGFYRVSPAFPCHRCPCNHHRSSRSCSFVNGQVKCNSCVIGYTGNLCHKCTYGYFPFNGLCERCNCNGNHDPKRSFMCSPATGQCLDCMFNTTGYYCEKCAPGYDGDPIKAKNCTLISDLNRRSKAPAVGVIAAVCVVIILSLSALAGFIVYRKWKHFPLMKPFWTVELREDHEGVNFSEIPAGEHNGFPGDSRNFDDMNFYEKQHRVSKKGKQQSYAPLQEDI